MTARSPRRPRCTLDTPPAAPAIPERAIQAACIEYLRYRGYYILRLNSGALPNAQGRSVRMLPAGTPDVLAIKDGRALFVEMKRAGAKPTVLQAMTMDTLSRHGARCLVATSVEDLQAAGL